MTKPAVLLSRGVWLLAVLVVAWLAVTQIGPRLPQAVAWVDSLGAVAGVLFVALYAAAVVLFIPASWLTLAAGAVFGLAWGVVYVFAGAVLGSGLAFLSGRHVARPWVERWASTSPRFTAIDRAVAIDGRRIVFLLRLTPLVPFTALNYLLGLTRISLKDMLLASPGMLPGTVLYVYYGRVIGDLTALAAGAAPPRGTGQYVLLAVGLVATLVVTVHVSRLARRAMDEARVAEPRRGEAESP
jgi:uncharacterized membrane protein YdjX (TVP38/TMEM64 family)